MDFALRIIAWQEKHGRHDLPWQKTRDAYPIWLAEVMLQQTQVKTVIPYYERFLARYPTLTALASAPLEDVAEMWSGLGYYARARNLHRCAQRVLAERAGQFSANPGDNAKLPGIGRSTAAAISVFAFSTRAAILDGNVRRIFLRYFNLPAGDGKTRQERELWTLAESLLPDERIETYTQGLMDLGAMVCTPRKPACAACPLGGDCVTHRDGRQIELPPPRAARPLPQRSRDLLLLTDGQRVLVERQRSAGVWGGLLSLPALRGDSPLTDACCFGCLPLRVRTLGPYTHSLTHVRLVLTIHWCEISSPAAGLAQGDWQWLSLSEVEKAALPSPIRKILLMLAQSAPASATACQVYDGIAGVDDCLRKSAKASMSRGRLKRNP